MSLVGGFLSGCVMIAFIWLCLAYPAAMAPIVLVLMGAMFIGLAASGRDGND